MRRYSMSSAEARTPTLPHSPNSDHGGNADLTPLERFLPTNWRINRTGVAKLDHDII